MGKRFLVGLAILELVIAVPVSAADWSGAHIGINAGYGWGDGDTRFEPLPSAATFVNFIPTKLHTDPSGALLGGQIGYNWQFDKIVPGVEADIAVVRYPWQQDAISYHSKQRHTIPRCGE